MFEALVEATQAEFAALVDQENKESDKNWTRITSGPFSTAPIDRQKCIECIGPLIEPLLDMLIEATGWKMSLFADRPEPADKGCLKMFNVHSGRTKSDVPLKFPAADCARYKQTTATFSSFLRRCYDVEECQACALSKAKGFLQIAATTTTSHDGTICLHNVGYYESTVLPQELYEARNTAPAPTPTPTTIISSTIASTTTHQAAPSTALEPPTSASSSILGSNNPMTTSTVRSGSSIGSQDGASMMEGVVPSSKQPLSGLGQSTAPRDRDNSPTPPLTLPPHPLFDLVLSPSLRQSPPASPSQPMHVTVEKLASPTTGSVQLQKRKEAPTENVDGGDGSTSDRSTKKSKGRSGDKAHAKTSAPTNRPTCTRTSGSTSTSATTLQDNRTSQAATPSSMPTPTLPTHPVVSNASKPSWFTSAMGMMENKDLGSSWNQLLKAWAAFEAKSDFKESKKKLSMANRPNAVKAWIQQAWSPAWNPLISDTAAYGLEFKKWWSALQPGWRKSCSREILFSKVVGDWEVLHRLGLNGILSVVAGLFFWRVALQEVDYHEEWNSAVSNCTLMLTALCAE